METISFHILDKKTIQNGFLSTGETWFHWKNPPISMCLSSFESNVENEHECIKNIK